MRHWRGPRRKLTPEETAANAARKAERLAAVMHCQICGRAILANTGHIAHHGYTRPDRGWQTSSCFGARARPFEVSRDTVARFVTALKNWREAAIKARAETEAETSPLTLTYGVYNRNTGKRDPIFIDVTRATFESVRAEHTDVFRTYSWDSYDKVKAARMLNHDHKIAGLAADIIEFQKRFDGWTQTHAWQTETQEWVKL
jgi:hypothetical protein